MLPAQSMIIRARKHFPRAFAAILLGLAGCTNPSNDGSFVHAGGAEDLGFAFNTVDGPTGQPTTQVDGLLDVFGPGESYPSATYQVDGLWAPGGTAVSGNLLQSSTVVGTFSAQLVSTSGDPRGEEAVAVFSLPDGVRNETLLRTEIVGGDPYKCWYGPGSCYRALGDTACSELTPAGMASDGTPKWNFAMVSIYFDQEGTHADSKGVLTVSDGTTTNACANITMPSPPWQQCGGLDGRVAVEVQGDAFSGAYFMYFEGIKIPDAVSQLELQLTETGNPGEPGGVSEARSCALVRP